MATDRFATRLPTSLATLGSAQSNSLDTWGGGVRLLAAPTWKFNRHWLAHATFQANTQPFFPYEAYHVNRPLVRGRLLQGYLAYTTSGSNRSVTVKAGQIATAFGDFSRRYSDTDNPLIGAPQPYGSYLLVRPDELPCTNFDLQHQQTVHPNISAYHCAPWESYSYGVLPVTPYGVFGGEVDVNYRDLDARFQLTNSNPSNPKSVLASDQSLQWAGGAGYTFFHRLRVGVSAFMGNWLDGKAAKQVRECCRRKRYCACGKGIDVQYRSGRLAVTGEWMRLHYNYPGFIHSPSVTYAYAETKVNLHPRWYVAGRAGTQRHGHVLADVNAAGHEHALIDRTLDPSTPTFQPNKLAVEVGVGYRPTRRLLMKASQQWVRRAEAFGPKDHVFLLQLVATLPDVWKASSR
ncbi:hypothetical protein F183_A11120 [Bryobacterales bacterium F-183]|nr:hypothetical protein F183_A11120 [Bryobacterales bacterium F-183]